MRDIETQDPFQLIGTTIEGKYRVTSVVGDGGFGVVYRAVHKGFDEPVAIKCLKLPSKIADKDRDALLEQLRDEGRLLLRLSRATSGIVQALDTGAFTTAEGVWVPYLVLEWLEGETLAQYLRGRMERGEGPLSVADSVKLLEPAARALAVAHAQKVAHRDVKPQNLFLTQVGSARTLKVLDFGIAKVLSDHPTFTQALAATKLGPTAFTPRYGAPEQFNKKRGATGPWTDVFALALIVVEIASGRQALDGDDPTELYIASADPAIRPTLRARGMKAPEPVERVLAKALSVEPKHRYADAGEFWDALAAAVIEAGASASVVSTGYAGGASAAQTQLSTEEFAAEQRLDVSTDREGTPSPMDAEPRKIPPTIPMTRQATDASPRALAATVPATPLDATKGEAKEPTKEALTRESSTKDLSTKDSSTKDSSTKESLTKNSSTKESSTKESSTRESSTKEAMTREASTKEAPVQEASSKEAPEAAPSAPEEASKPAVEISKAEDKAEKSIAPERVSDKPKEPAPTQTKSRKREEDPMAETPLPERAPSFSDAKKPPPPPPEPAVAAKSPAEEPSKKDQESAAKPKAEGAAAPFGAAAQGRQTSWVRIAVVAAAASIGAAIVANFSGGDQTGKPTSPSGKAMTSGAPMASAKPKATAKPSASASASAAPSAAPAVEPPPIVPDDMIYIAPGTSKMGADATAREVTLSKGFFIDRNEVTVHAYQACMARRMCSAADHVSIPPEQEDAGIEGLSSRKEFADTWSSHCNEPRKALDNPINCVDFSSAESFCRWKGKRLPTEAEWERAARGLEAREYAWGEGAPTCDKACYDRNSECLVRGSEGVNTCAAGSKTGDKTPEGAFDFGGNVSEWVADGFADVPAGGQDPTGDAASGRRVIRGGSLLDAADKLRAIYRAGAVPETAHVSIGFRCAADVPAKGAAAPQDSGQPAPTKGAPSAAPSASGKAGAGAHPPRGGAK